MKHSLIVAISISIIYSCNSHPEIVKTNFRVILPDTSITHRSNWFYDEAINLCEELNFARLDKGVDSISIRIWISGMVIPLDVISIHYSNNNWFASKTYYWTSFPQPGEKGYKGGITSEGLTQMVLDSLQTFRVKPKIPFSDIIDSVQYFNILGIPSQEEIPNFRDTVADGFNYVIEIATKDYYKIISYHCPAAYAKEEINNRKVTEFLDFISRNLSGFMICWIQKMKD